MEHAGDAYTLALWRVKEGKEEEFVEAWKGDLADFFLGLPNPPGTGTLIRSVEDPQLFYSFGPWRSLEDIQQMRSHPHTGDDRQVSGSVRGGEAWSFPGGGYCAVDSSFPRAISENTSAWCENSVQGRSIFMASGWPG